MAHQAENGDATGNANGNANGTIFELKPVSFDDLASSKPFLFTIGPNKREFTMHSALVASQSPAFERLVNNSNFKEGQSYHVELGNVEEETFIRFFQYAYTGKYDEGEVEPPPVDDELAEPIGLEPPESVTSVEDRWVFGALSSSKKKKVSKSSWAPDEPAPIRATPKGIYDQTCRTIVFEALAQKFVKKVSKLAVKVSTANKNQVGGPATSNPYLLHAKVFVFADYWGVPGLKEVSIYKLSSALQGVGLLVNTKCVRDRLVALVEYCYDEPRPEELLSLVHLYAAFRLPQLWESVKFQELFGDHKELSIALMSAVVKSGL